jgi:methionyl-tRNA synthetase
MEAMWSNIGAHEALGELCDQRVDSAGTWGQLTAGVRVHKGESLFPRLEDPESI